MLDLVKGTDVDGGVVVNVHCNWPNGLEVHGARHENGCWRIYMVDEAALRLSSAAVEELAMADWFLGGLPKITLMS